MDLISLALPQFMLFAVVFVFLFLNVMRNAFSFSLRNQGLADRAARREQELHDSEHDIHLP